MGQEICINDHGQLASEENKFSNLVKSIPLGIIEIDQSGLILAVNSLGKRLFAENGKAQICGSKISDFIVQDEVAVFESALKMVATLEDNCRIEINMIKSGGVIFPAVLYLDLIKSGEDENVAGFCVVVSDITKRVAAETERSILQRQIFHSSKLASIGELAASVGHEINNPLTIIDGYIAIIEGKLGKELLESTGIKEFFNIQREAILRIVGIVSGLRSYARVDKDTLEPIDLHTVIRESLKLVKYIYAKEGILLELDLAAERDHILGNIGKIQQILMNLLSNARDAVEDKEDNKRISISTLNNGSQIEFYVTDNGCGIDSDKIEKVFETFYTTKPIGKGTGLGMSIIKQLLAMMNGDIFIDSKAGVGSTFKLVFPVVDREKVEQKVEKKQLEQFTGRILVLDDEEDLREILDVFLSSFGLEVDLVECGQDGLNKLHEHDYDFILTDLKMPKMGGVEFVKKIEKVKGSKAKIIVMTGDMSYDDPVTKVAQIENLIDGVLMKPFNMETVNEVLKKVSLQQKESLA